VDGEVWKYHFVRIDRFINPEDAFRMIKIKVRQIIDEQGDLLFKP